MVTSTPTDQTTDVAYATELIPLEDLALADSAFQSRRDADPELQSLADDIRIHGLLQPILCRRYNGKREVVAGHRRLRAVRILGWTTIPGMTREATTREAAEMTFAENINRKDLNPIEKARFLRRYMDEFSVTQEETGERFQLAQETISTLVRLLDAPAPIVEYVEKGDLSFSHGRELLRLKEHPERMIELANGATGGAGSVAFWDGTPSVVQLAEAVDDELENIERLAKEPPKPGDPPAPKTLDKVELKERLIEGLVPTKDRKHPYVDEDGRAVYFRSVRFEDKLHSIVSPALPDEGWSPSKDAELMAQLEAIGVAIPEYGVQLVIAGDEEEWVPAIRLGSHHQRKWARYIPTAEVLDAVGAKKGMPCPCDGDHITVRGFGKDNGYSDTSTSKVVTETYCADPRLVVLALAGHLLAEASEIRALQQADELTVDNFLADHIGDREWLLFLFATMFGDELSRIAAGVKPDAEYEAEPDSIAKGLALLQERPASVDALMRTLAEEALFQGHFGKPGDITALIEQITGPTPVLPQE